MIIGDAPDYKPQCPPTKQIVAGEGQFRSRSKIPENQSENKIIIYGGNKKVMRQRLKELKEEADRIFKGREFQIYGDA